ncbi:hypothetical protein ACTHR6_26295 [Ralstonia holmesii]|uniref:hypothetical protein n=1 Tax=Ralstonia TaxID=48736 RepID=UPI0004699439|nr:hypothetical protein [Ralstonia pickettii]
MKLADEANQAFNLIAIGAWNPAIFSPQWTKSHLVADPAQEVVMAIPMAFPGGGGAPPRLTLGNVNLYPSAATLILDCVQFDDESLRAVGQTFGTVCDLLPHTPITAIGANFRYTGKIADEPQLAELFLFSDSRRIDADKYRSTGALIRRSYRLEDGGILNLVEESVGTDVRVEFNFHFDVTSAAEAKLKAAPELILAKKAEAIAFLENAYEIELE